MTFATGGSAFYKKWFEIYEAEAARSPKSKVFEVMGGDSFGGATPPISNFFGDKPTPLIMGMMGIDIDAIGNHSFDRGQAYLRTELIPLAPFPMISSNVVFPNGQTPAEWSKSQVFDIGGGMKLGFVGFTTVSTPEVVFPGNLGPFEVRPLLPAVNAEAARLANSTDVIDPRPRRRDLRDGHQPIRSAHRSRRRRRQRRRGHRRSQRPPGRRRSNISVTENRGKGLRFTRMRLVVGPGKDGVVYKTADYHKPWTIGLTRIPRSRPRSTSSMPRWRRSSVPRSEHRPSGSRVPISAADPTVDCANRSSATWSRTPCATYASIGAQLRSPTRAACGPTSRVRFRTSDDCGSYTPPPFVITRGQSLAVPPFGNVAVTVDITGAELKTMLENGVSLSVSTDAATLNPTVGARPQVSGLCFHLVTESSIRNRVISVVHADAAGDCTANPVDLSASAHYLVVQNDFTATGGDGYSNVASRMTTQDILEEPSPTT